MADALIREREGQVALLTLNRPERLNALNNRLQIEQTQDAREGIAAFLEKRASSYTGS